MSMKLSSYDLFKTEYDPSKISSIGKGQKSVPETQKSQNDKSIQNAKNAQSVQVQSQSGQVQSSKENISITPENTNTASHTAKLDDVSVGFNKKDSYDYIGNDKDITKLDKNSVVDSKQKSGIFNDYLYYAGSSASGNSQSSHFISDDGSVVLKGRLAPME